MDFVVQLLKETGVLIVNGSGFDPVYGKGHARIVFLPPDSGTRRSLQRAGKVHEEKQKQKIITS